MSSEHQPNRRLFVALWPPDKLRNALEHETRTAIQLSEGRSTPAANLHLTLAFLGSVPEARIAAIFAAMRLAVFAPFEVILSKLSWWPRQQLLCLEPREDSEPLLEAVRRLQSALRGSGFEIEQRRFRAHMTLARDVHREPVFKPIKELHWQVDRVELVESQTSPRGSLYTLLRDRSS